MPSLLPAYTTTGSGLCQELFLPFFRRFSTFDKIRPLENPHLTFFDPGNSTFDRIRRFYFHIRPYSTKRGRHNCRPRCNHIVLPYAPQRNSWRSQFMIACNQIPQPEGCNSWKSNPQDCFSNASGPCLHQGQTKSAGSWSPS